MPEITCANTRCFACAKSICGLAWQYGGSGHDFATRSQDTADRLYNRNETKDTTTALVTTTADSSTTATSARARTRARAESVAATAQSIAWYITEGPIGTVQAGKSLAKSTAPCSHETTSDYFSIESTAVTTAARTIA